MLLAELNARLAAAGTSSLASASHDVRIMDAAIRPIADGLTLCGRARLVTATPSDNKPLHDAVRDVARGDVIVVDAGGDLGHGIFGEILATCCLVRGGAGVVIDGAVRDIAALRRLELPVFAAGRNPRPATKQQPGRPEARVRCGGVTVERGDFIVGDDDGVVVVPHAAAQQVASKSAALAEREAEIIAGLKDGGDLADLFARRDLPSVEGT